MNAVKSANRNLKGTVQIGSCTSVATQRGVILHASALCPQQSLSAAGVSPHKFSICSWQSTLQST